jgi:hypothetical protein
VTLCSVNLHIEATPLEHVDDFSQRVCLDQIVRTTGSRVYSDGEPYLPILEALAHLGRAPLGKPNCIDSRASYCWRARRGSTRRWKPASVKSSTWPAARRRSRGSCGRR